MTQEQKDRLSKEINNLINKINKLGDFIRTNAFYNLDRINKDLLYEQYHAMLTYLQVLGKRAEINNIKFMEEN